MMTSKRKLMFLSRPRINDVEILSSFPHFIDELCEKSLNTLPGKFSHLQIKKRSFYIGCISRYLTILNQNLLSIFGVENMLVVLLS